MSFMDMLFGYREPMHLRARKTLNHWQGTIVKCQDCGYAKKVQSKRGIAPCTSCGADSWAIIDMQEGF